jgi:hypothetical protein
VQENSPMIRAREEIGHVESACSAGPSLSTDNPAGSYMQVANPVQRRYIERYESYKRYDQGQCMAGVPGDLSAGGEGGPLLSQALHWYSM